MRSTLADIAREAGVSNATVDRVLNDRPGVRERTRAAVLRAAQRVGYLDGEPGAPESVSRPLTLDFVLPAGTNSFMDELRRQIEAQAARLSRLHARIHVIEGFNPASLAATILGLAGESDGAAVVALDHPEVREAMRALSASGVPVVTLLSDVHHATRAGYVGIDNRSAGRLAGYLVGRLLGSGKHRVALFAGSLAYRGHEEREMGFRHILAEEFPNLDVIDLAEVRDDTEQAYLAARETLKTHSDIDAIYNIGAGTRGIARAVEESGRAPGIVFVGHDLTEHTKRFLLNGTMDVVIDQNARVEAREVLAQLTRLADGQSFDMHPLRIAAFFKENLPE